MAISTILLFIVIAVIAYLILRFVFGPLLGIVTSFITVLILIYILQHFFGFDTNTAFGPFGKYLNLDNWPYINVLTKYLNQYINQAVSFFNYLVGNMPKTK